jgi:type IV pilus assembly protein PilF
VQWIWRLPLALTILVMAGCASMGGVDDDEGVTGQLGKERSKSPATLYVEMGIAYMRDNQPAVALKKLKKAISVDPKNAEAHNVLAILYERLGEDKLAGESYARAIKLQPQDPYIRNAQGSFFCKQGLYEEAEMEFERALSNPLYPTPWVAMTNAGLCAERNGDKEKAENYYRRALTANDSYFQALIQMGKLSFEQDNPLSARAYLERYNAVAEPTAASLWLGVQVERKLGDRLRAREYRTRLLKTFPDAPEVQLLHQSER